MSQRPRFESGSRYNTDDMPGLPGSSNTYIWKWRKWQRTGFGSPRLQVQALPSRLSASVVQGLECLASNQGTRVRISPGAL